MFTALRKYYKDGALSWRNPLALAIYCVLASVVAAIAFLYTQSVWVTGVAIAIWVFMGGMLLFCAIGAGAILKERRKMRSKRNE